MSQLRRYRRGLQGRRMQVAFKMQQLLAAHGGDIGAITVDIPAALERAFVQKEKEVYAPATSV